MIFSHGSVHAKGRRVCGRSRPAGADDARTDEHRPCRRRADARWHNRIRLRAAIQANFLDQYLKDTVTVREYKTTEQRDLDLTAGRIDGIFTSLSAMNATFAKPEFKEYGNTGPLFSGGVFGEGVSIGLRKEDTELKASFDKAINEMLADGTLLTLSKKWFKADYTPTK